MTSRSRRIVVAGVLLLGLALPVQAQGDTSTVHFDGVGFEFDHALGRSVSITQVPVARRGTTGLSEDAPAHITFALYRRLPESKRPPAIFDAPGTVRVYATSALEGSRNASRQLSRLQELLAERPDPATVEALNDRQGVDVPFLPVEEAAAQSIAARVEFIDTPELSGIAYVTGFRQDFFPFVRDDFLYTFQGLSADGQWYVAVDWDVRATAFPRRVSQADARRVGRNTTAWERYIRQSVATLDAAEQSAFRPSLATLDALVRSIDFDSVVAPSPSPSVAPPVSVAPASAAPPAPSAAGSVAPTSPVASAAP